MEISVMQASNGYIQRPVQSCRPGALMGIAPPRKKLQVPPNFKMKHYKSV